MNPKLIPCHYIRFGKDELISLLTPNDSMQRFIEKLRITTGCKYVFLVDSGRSGLYIILKALDIQKKKVMVNAYTSQVVPQTIRSAGYIPSPVDIELKHLGFENESFYKGITDETGIIIITYLFGLPAPIEFIKDIAKEKGIYLVEDCANSLGSLYDGVPTGALGDVSFFSFRIGKPLSSGGGAICTTDEKLAEKISNIISKIRQQTPIKSFLAALHNVIESILFQPPFYGLITQPIWNATKNTSLRHLLVQGSSVDTVYEPTLDSVYPMPKRQTAVALTRIKMLSVEIKKRRECANNYFSKLKDLPINFPREPDKGYSNYLAFPLILNSTINLEEFANYLLKKGIDTSRFHYHVPFSQYHDVGYSATEFPYTEYICNQMITIPIGPTLSITQQSYICEAIHNFFDIKSKEGTDRHEGIS